MGQFSNELSFFAFIYRSSVGQYRVFRTVPGSGLLFRNKQRMKRRRLGHVYKKFIILSKVQT